MAVCGLSTSGYALSCCCVLVVELSSRMRSESQGRMFHMLPN